MPADSFDFQPELDFQPEGHVNKGTTVAPINDSWGARATSLGRGLVAAGGDLAGMAVDTFNNANRVVTAAAGLPYLLSGHAADAPTWITDNGPWNHSDNVVMSSRWAKNKISDITGIGQGAVDPRDPAQRYIHAIAEASAGAALMSPSAPLVSAALAAVGGTAGQAVADVGGGPDAQLLASLAAGHAAGAPVTAVAGRAPAYNGETMQALTERLSGKAGTQGGAGGWLSRSIEGVLAKAPGSMEQIHDAVREVQTGIRARVSGILDNLTADTSPTAGGEAVTVGAPVLSENKRAETKAAYDQFEAAPKNNATVNLKNIFSVLKEAYTGIADMAATSSVIRTGTQAHLEDLHRGLATDAAIYGLRQAGVNPVHPDDLLPTPAKLPDNVQEIKGSPLGDGFLVDNRRWVKAEDAPAAWKPQDPLYKPDDVVTLHTRDAKGNYATLQFLKDEANPILADVQAQPVLPFDSMYEFHRRIGQRLGNRNLLANENIDQGALTRVWAASKDATETALAQTPGAARNLLNRANSLYSDELATNDKLDSLVNRGQTPESVFTGAISETRTGATKFNLALKAATASGPLGGRQFVASFLDHLGNFTEIPEEANLNNGWTTAKFTRNWEKLDPSVRASVGEILGPQYMQDLNDISAWQKGMAANRLYSNPSGTGQATAHAKLAGGILKGTATVGAMALEALSTGHVVPGAGTAVAATAGYLAAPIVAQTAAKLMTNPTFVRWMASTKELPPSALPAASAALVQMGQQKKNKEMVQFGQALAESANGEGGQ